MSTFQKVRHVLQLWNIIRAVSTILLQEGEDVVELSARMCRVEFRQFAVNGSPSTDLFLCIFDSWDLFSTAMRFGA